MERFYGTKAGDKLGPYELVSPKPSPRPAIPISARCMISGRTTCGRMEQPNECVQGTSLPGRRRDHLQVRLGFRLTLGRNHLVGIDAHHHVRDVIGFSIVGFVQFDTGYVCT